jgi:hypothetical protein
VYWIAVNPEVDGFVFREVISKAGYRRYLTAIISPLRKEEFWIVTSPLVK